MDHLTPALVFHSGVVVRKAHGIYVEDLDGRTYMDFSSGLATLNVGHCPPKVVEAARAQMESMIHAGCIYRYGSEPLLAKRLAGITPGGIEMFFFSNSGAEAVEGAVKLARHATGRQGVIAFTGGFHGRTLGALSLTTSSARYRTGYHPLLPSVYHSPYPYCHRCPVGQVEGSCSTECFGFLTDVVLKHHISPGEVACVVMEPVLGEGGYVVPPKEFVARLKGLCEREGILFVADEVQSGFGRTGRWFASEHFDLKPDIITIAKGIASGFPLSAVGAASSLMKKWPPGAHGTTFGGNPVSCSASVATIETIEEEGLLENASKVGSYALKRLDSIKETKSSIGDVRGLGLMIGVEFEDNAGQPDKAALERVMNRCIEAGLIIVECGADKNIARLMPPLTTTEDEMKRALDIFEEALG